MAIKDKIRTYSSDDIDVQWSLKRCIHAAECVRRLPEVFDKDAHPWINPEKSDAETIAEVVTHCPTGALHFTRKDGGAAEQTPTENTIQLDENGPYYISGDVTLKNADGEVLLTDTRVALCRCGKSNNKPFCDTMHRKIEDFDGPGTLVDASKITSEDNTEGGSLSITATLNGSLLVEGNYTIVDTDGEALTAGEKTWLCRCGGSQNKPFCDSSHKKIGFIAE